MIEKNADGKLSAGYPAVEKLIETEDFDKINNVFEGAYLELDTVHRKKRGLKRGRDAKKAMSAIEQVVDLFKELLEIKYSLQEMFEKSSKKSK